MIWSAQIRSDKRTNVCFYFKESFTFWLDLSKIIQLFHICFLIFESYTIFCRHLPVGIIWDLEKNEQIKCFSDLISEFSTWALYFPIFRVPGIWAQGIFGSAQKFIANSDQSENYLWIISSRGKIEIRIFCHILPYHSKEQRKSFHLVYNSNVFF